MTVWREADTFVIPGLPQHLGRLGFGGHPVGGHGWGQSRDDDTALAALRQAVECGYVFFDTADVYGLGVSEILHRKMLESFPDRREDLVVATKGGVAWDETGRTRRDGSPNYLRSAVEDSLQRLGVDCIDLYYLHWPDERTPVADSVEALVRLRDQGKIRTIGLSNVSPQDVVACRDAGISAIQVGGNLLQPVGLIEYLVASREVAAAMVCYSGLADGLLTGKLTSGRCFPGKDHRSRYPLFQQGVYDEALQHVQQVTRWAEETHHSTAQVSIRWLLDSGAADCVLVGSSNPRNVRENAGAVGWSLPRECVSQLAIEAPMESSPEYREWAEGLSGGAGSGAEGVRLIN